MRQRGIIISNNDHSYTCIMKLPEMHEPYPSADCEIPHLLSGRKEAVRCIVPEKCTSTIASPLQRIILNG